MEIMRTVCLCGAGWLAVGLVVALFFGQVAKLNQRADEWTVDDILRREG